MRKWCLYFLILISSSVYSALPPLVQSINEIKAILLDNRLSEIIPVAESIEKIIKIEHGYLLLTPKFGLKVNVNYLPQEKPGPLRFNLHFQEPFPRKESD